MHPAPILFNSTRAFQAFQSSLSPFPKPVNYGKFSVSKVVASLCFSTLTRPGFESNTSPTLFIMEPVYAA